MNGLWDQLVEAVCRPPRDDSYTEADLVGGRRASFRLYNRRYYREDVTLVNVRGLKLQGSHYRPCVVTSSDGRLPCVVYCHCNSGSRRDAEEILYHMLPKGITVFAFDFAGSGLSEGSYVTLGALEVDDLAAVVKYLREEGSTSTIGLWGRSMGAVTALLYSQQDPSIAGMVLDSPFSRLVDLMMELGTDQQLRIPKPLLKVALSMLKRSVRKRAGFSVDKVAPLDCVGASYIPALFGHAQADTFVDKHHSKRLHDAYAGEKNLVNFDGDHNSVRPDFFYSSALIFLMQALQVEELVGPAVDLQALPEDALPHLAANNRSIYVTASRGQSEVQGGAGAQPGSGGSSPDSAPSSPSSHQQRRPVARTLTPPWSVGHLQRPSGPLAAALAALPPVRSTSQGLQVQDGGAGDEQALAADLGAGLHLTEEEALQLALEASLRDAHDSKQADGGAAGGGKGGSPGSASASPVPSQQQQQQQEQQGIGGQAAGDVPQSLDEEEAMLAAALAASLDHSQQAAASQAGGGVADSLLGALKPAATAVTSSETEPPPCSDQAAGQHVAGEGSSEQEVEVSAQRAHAAQAVAGAHAADEAAVVKEPALELQRALSGSVSERPAVD
ncbi:hypothetical protein D9Q98_002985 [Chlorella vulgaris]|uniref:Serine aminopeptidase S33 domain-containing protein n=1 Tax=Chlorella vulgaris TaxID=3077 RepID=A0A9D4YZZ2_CHLVU|nr:hypothetical protein D9Q98_002985 [Chlorella vulgaris]